MDKEQILKEWIEKYKWDISYQDEASIPIIIFAWWIRKFNSLLSTLEKEVEELKVFQEQYTDKSISSPKLEKSDVLFLLHSKRLDK